MQNLNSRRLELLLEFCPDEGPGALSGFIAKQFCADGVG
jgi:hypothetical protein